MTSAVKARDWLAELRATDDEEEFTNLVEEVRWEAPELRVEVCAIAGEKFGANGEKWAARIFVRPELPGAELELIEDEAEEEEASFKNPAIQPPAAPKADDAQKLNAALAKVKRRQLPKTEEAPKKDDALAKIGLSLEKVMGRKEEPTSEEEEEPATTTQPELEEEDPEASRALLRLPAPVSGVGTPGEAKDLQEQLLALMNRKHAVIRSVGGKARVLEWIRSQIDAELYLPSFQTFEDFRNGYLGYPVPQLTYSRKGFANLEDKDKFLGHWWLEHPGHAKYESVMFEPGGPKMLDNGYLNLWQGWGMIPKPGRWDRMRQHIGEILAAGDGRAEDYINRWMAYGFQNPKMVAEAAMVFKGKEGSGRGILGRALRKIYGPHGTQISQPSHLTGKFNAHLWTCCFLFADEAFWAGDKQHEGVLKALITEDGLLIEKKGIDPIFTRNYVKVFMASNEEWVIPADQDARRFAMFDADNRYAQNACSPEERKAYFAALYREGDEGGLAAMLYDLQRFDLEGWHPREIYQTAALIQQKKETLRGLPRWYEGLLQRGALPHGGFGGWGHEPNCAFTEHLLNDALKDPSCKYVNDEKLTAFLKKQGCDNWRTSKTRGWQFLPLPEARVRWETQFGSRWPWREALEEWVGF